MRSPAPADRTRVHPTTYQRIFSGHEGQQVLNELVWLFHDGPLVGRDANKTYLNLGKREVVQFILRKIQVAELGETGEETDEA